jgi:hypothetical protein
MKNSFREGTLRPAIDSLFNQEIEAGRAFLVAHLQSCPEDCLAYAIRAGVEFYGEVLNWILSCGDLSGGSVSRADRMKIDDRSSQFILESLDRAEKLAQTAMGRADSADLGIFTHALAKSIRRDYEGLVHHRWLASLTRAQEANLLGRDLLKANPNAHDAYFIFAVSEYLISRVPAMARPFAKIPGISGNRSKAIQFCLVASKTGCYFREFALGLLVVLYTEDGKPEDALSVLSQLAERFPKNSMIAAERDKRQKMPTT